MATEFMLVLVTAKDQTEAENISQTLLDEKLIACANIIHPVLSCFLWQDKIDRVEECLVVMKSRQDLFAELAERVRDLHSYEVPEILALPILDGDPTYLSWLKTNLKK